VSFRYQLVEEQDSRDFIKQVNYYGAKGYRVLRFFRAERLYVAVMEKFSSQGG